MATPTSPLDRDRLERERLLALAEDYRNQGYEVQLFPSPDDLPDFLKAYRPSMVLHRSGESAIVEVKSRASLSSSFGQALQNLARAVDRYPGWRFELVVENPEEVFTGFQTAERSLQLCEIGTRLQVARRLASQNLEAAVLFIGPLFEATLRLLAEREGLSLKRFDSVYLVKQLAVEGTISQSEYRSLMEMIALRNAIAHGFKTSQLTQAAVDAAIELLAQLLKTLTPVSEAGENSPE